MSSSRSKFWEVVDRFIPQRSYHRRILSRGYWMLPAKFRVHAPVREALVHLFRSENPRIIQIGANDGCRNDPLHYFLTNFDCSAILVEPHPSHFARLQEVYAGRQNTMLHNVAIGDPGQFTLYWSPKRSGIESLHRAHVVRNLKAEDRASIKGTRVTCIDFEMLLDKMPEFRECGGLVIDTEGHDGKILGMVDFDRFRCDVIIYEEKHLESSERVSVERKLRSNGYLLDRSAGDCVALHSNPTAATLRRLSRRWQKRRRACREP